MCVFVLHEIITYVAGCDTNIYFRNSRSCEIFFGVLYYYYIIVTISSKMGRTIVRIAESKVEASHSGRI